MIHLKDSNSYLIPNGIKFVANDLIGVKKYNGFVVGKNNNFNFRSEASFDDSVVLFRDGKIYDICEKCKNKFRGFAGSCSPVGAYWNREYPCEFRFDDGVLDSPFLEINGFVLYNTFACNPRRGPYLRSRYYQDIVFDGPTYEGFALTKQRLSSVYDSEVSGIGKVLHIHRGKLTNSYGGENARIVLVTPSFLFIKRDDSSTIDRFDRDNNHSLGGIFYTQEVYQCFIDGYKYILSKLNMDTLEVDGLGKLIDIRYSERYNRRADYVATFELGGQQYSLLMTRERLTNPTASVILRQKKMREGGLTFGKHRTA